MSKKTALTVLTALFPKSFNRESIGTVTRLVKALDNIKAGGWHNTRATFGRAHVNQKVHIAEVAVKAGYMKAAWDSEDARCRVYRITAAGKRFLARLEKLTQ